MGRYYELAPPPDGSTEPSEDEVSISATHAMRATFAASGCAPEVLRLFDALATLLTRNGRKH